MHSEFPVAVHLFFIRDRQILLLRRFNTGYEDGKYSVVAGHIEAGETVTQAAIREAYEEVGVVLEPADMQVVHVMHRRSDDERVDFFVLVDHGQFSIRIRNVIYPSRLICYNKSGDKNEKMVAINYRNYWNNWITRIFY